MKGKLLMISWLQLRAVLSEKLFELTTSYLLLESNKLLKVKNGNFYSY